jgi:diadenylate cyclase
MQVLLGIVILALLTVFTKQIVRFNTLGWLLGNFWVIGLILIAIIFQPELRSALAQLGSEPIGRIFLQVTESGVIKKLVPAVKELSIRRIGALIVLEQETGLKNFIEAGVIIDAEISTELLLSIFSPSSILHDGAVIIKDSRLTAASCILPVSGDHLLNKDLGTRHMAAIGITEISDAIVVVVSEETGAMSLVYKRRLEYNINIDELQEKLKHLHDERLEKRLLHRNKSYRGSKEEYVQKV